MGEATGDGRRTEVSNGSSAGAGTGRGTEHMVAAEEDLGKTLAGAANTYWLGVHLQLSKPPILNSWRPHAPKIRPTMAVILWLEPHSALVGREVVPALGDGEESPTIPPPIPET